MKKKIMLGTSDAWWMSRLSHQPSKPAYYIVDWRIFDIKLWLAICPVDEIYAVVWWFFQFRNHYCKSIMTNKEISWGQGNINYLPQSLSSDFKTSLLCWYFFNYDKLIIITYSAYNNQDCLTFRLLIWSKKAVFILTVCENVGIIHQLSEGGILLVFCNVIVIVLVRFTFLSFYTIVKLQVKVI